MLIGKLLASKNENKGKETKILYSESNINAYKNYRGRYKTIMWAIACAMIGHILLVVSSVPSIIVHSDRAFGIFCAAITVMGLGTGGFKSNISPLIAEQYTVTKKKVITLSSGERVIMDPNLTISRIYMYFYMMINIGSLIGQITMVFAEKWVGFWLAFLLPTVMFTFCPIVMMWGRKRYNRTPPTGSVMATFFHFMGFSMKGRWSANPVALIRNINDGTFWDKNRPSQVPQESKPYWMTFDDAWVDELKRALSACRVFCFYPIYWLAYGQIDNNLTAQAALMNTHGLPNEILNNINPLTLIVFIPIFDMLVYPSLRKKGFIFTPIKKITMGFFMGVLAMVWAAILQWKIYEKHPCGYHPTSTEECREKIAEITVWWQVGPYLLIGISEIFASITGLEYAFSKSPKNMRSVVMSLFLFTNAFSTAIGYALVDLAADPLLIWNYVAAAILALLAGIAFWFCFRNLDKQEDALNDLQASTYIGNETTNKTNEEEPSRVNVNAQEKQ